jgi:hypothetical protein
VYAPVVPQEAAGIQSGTLVECEFLDLSTFQTQLPYYHRTSKRGNEYILTTSRNYPIERFSNITPN